VTKIDDSVNLATIIIHHWKQSYARIADERNRESSAYLVTSKGVRCSKAGLGVLGTPTEDKI